MESNIRKIICFHEVGHAVMSVAVNYGNLMLIKITPQSASLGDSSYMGGAYIKQTTIISGKTDPSEIWKNGLLNMAGAIAEIKFKDLKNEKDYWEKEEDFNKDRHYVDRAINELLTRLDYIESNYEGVFDKLWNEAKAIIENNWSKIVYIANYLNALPQIEADSFGTEMKAAEFMELYNKDY